MILDSEWLDTCVTCMHPRYDHPNGQGCAHQFFANRVFHGGPEYCDCETFLTEGVH